MQTNPSFWQKYAFWWLLLLALLVRQLPVLSLPLNWLESYFHELSHGLTAILTGGKIISIQLFTNGAGLCTSIGGSRFLISFMGYTGAILWGGLIYLTVSRQQQLATLLLIGLLTVIATSMLLWQRDVITLIISTCFLALFSILLRTSWRKKLHYIMQFIGLTVLLNALHSPLYLIDGRAKGDGATLAQITFIPEIVWVALWFLFALTMLYWLGKSKK